MTSSKENAGQDEKKFYDMITRNFTTVCEETKEQDVKIIETNNNKINNKKNNIYFYNNLKTKFKDKVFLTTEQYRNLVKKFGKEKFEFLKIGSEYAEKYFLDIVKFIFRKKLYRLK